jgi:phosphate transport system ATP-binding protein
MYSNPESKRISMTAPMQSVHGSSNPDANSNTVALKVRDLSFYYGTRKALEGVSMDILEGEVTALIGPSGCGKSTFIKAINRIGELEGKVRVDGKVEFFGQDLYDPKININRLRSQIGMVFQRPNPFPMSIYDNVAYGVRLFGRKSKVEMDEVVETALRGAALWEEVKDKLNTSGQGLSGGQQQRLCIARALAVRPKILLMDEPCSALDPIATLKIEELIDSHNMQQASRVSSYTAFFSTDESRIGQLVEFNSTSQIFMSASQPRTRDYIEGRFG